VKSVRTGRPRTVSDDAIFEAVSAVVTEVGPSGLTLAAVADRVGLSAPALTQRFGSKRGLLLAHAEAAVTAVDDVFNKVRSRSPTALSALRAGLLELTAGISSRDAIANNLALLYLDLTDPDLGAHAAKQSRLFRRAITQLVDEAISDGEINPTNAAELADTLYTVYNGSLVTWAIDGTGSFTRWLSKRIDRVLAHHERAAPPPPRSARVRSR
jgi:AcrR family transcriptional regulator